jgi:5-hydroxyisourate hydrolase
VSSISTHVLDTARGRPAPGLPIRLEKRDSDGWTKVDGGITNADGRVSLMPDGIAAGVYQMTFDTGAYFEKEGVVGFYPYVAVVFEISAADQHYHVPLLLSPYGYSTYRGS